MKPMNRFLPFKIIAISFFLAFVSCSKDSEEPEPVETDITVTTEDFSKTIDENPTNGQILGTVTGTTNIGNVSFFIEEQSPEAALEIDPYTGELKVADKRLFDFERYSTISATVEVVNGDVSKNALVTITVNDLSENKIYEGDIELKSQTEVDAFGGEGYTHITGNLYIGEIYNDLSDITDLTPLLNIRQVDGFLAINNNGILTTTLGMDNVASIGDGLSASYNPALEKIEGFENISTVPGNLYISENSVLSDFDGLKNISEVGGRLVLYSLQKIPNVAWLSNLTSVGMSLDISDCPTLLNIDGLSNLQNLGGNISIRQNELLDNLDGLQNLTATIEILSLTDNFSLLNLNGLHNVEITQILYLDKNKLLRNIDGISKMKSAEYVYIANNYSLLNIYGLQNLQSVTIDFTIVLNANLSSLNGLTSLQNVSGDFFIRGNPRLKDYCDVRDFLINGSVGTFYVNENGYNPTEQEIIDGNCSI